VASTADQTSPAIHVAAADLDHDAAAGCAANLLVRVMAGDALHLMGAKQSFIDGLSRQARARPGRRHWRSCACQRHGITDLVRGRIIELAIGRGERCVIREGNRMCDVQVGSDVRGVTWSNVARSAVGDTAELIDGYGTVVTAQAGLGSAVGLSDRGIQRGA